MAALGDWQIMRRIVSEEPELLQLVERIRMRKLTKVPKIPQAVTDATWLNLVTKWEKVAKKLRGRTLLSAILGALPEDAVLRNLLLALGAKA